MSGLGHEAFQIADRISQFRSHLIRFMQASRENFQPCEDWIQSARCEYINIHFVRHIGRPETGDWSNVTASSHQPDRLEFKTP